MINNGKHNAKDQRKPACSPTNPKIGGASKKITNTNCANDATFSSGVLSVLCAAADIANGKITALPPPIKRKPNSAVTGTNENTTQPTPKSMAIKL